MCIEFDTTIMCIKSTIFGEEEAKSYEGLVQQAFGSMAGDVVI
jgi:hypothetical protein